jgi:hypothetical protein
MNSNKCSDRLPEGLQALAADVDDLAAQDLAGLPDGVRAERVLALRRLVDRLEGQWLGDRAGVDACGAASTASWLRARLRLGAAASSGARTARALFAGPLTGTAQALCDGELSAAPAAALAMAPTTSPPTSASRPSRCWWRRPDTWTHPDSGAPSATWCRPPTPTPADHQAERRHGRRGVWWPPPWTAGSPCKGLLDPEAGQT